MRKKIVISSVAFIGIASATAAILHAAAQPVRTDSQMWEYKVFDARQWPDEAEFNKLGADYWELVAIQPRKDGMSAAIFKRPK